MPELFDDEQPKKEKVDADLILEAKKEAALLLAKMCPDVRLYDEDSQENALAERLIFEFALIDNEERKLRGTPQIGRERFATRIGLCIKFDQTEEPGCHFGTHVRVTNDCIRINDDIAWKVMSQLSPENRAVLAEHYFPETIHEFTAYLEQRGGLGYVDSVQRQLRNLHFELTGVEIDQEEID